MAGNQGQFSTNLGLPVLPGITDADPRLYNEFLLVYNALRSLAVQLDRATGLEFRDEISQAQYKVDGAQNTYIVGNMSKFYLIAGEALTFGQFVHVFTNGKVYKARGGIGNLNSVNRKCHGYCSSESVAAEDVVEVSTTGIIKTSGLVTGAGYNLYHNANIVDSGSNNEGVIQYIGLAISTTELLVQPSRDWYYINGTDPAIIYMGERDG